MSSDYILVFIEELTRKEITTSAELFLYNEDTDEFHGIRDLGVVRFLKVSSYITSFSSKEKDV